MDNIFEIADEAVNAILIRIIRETGRTIGDILAELEDEDVIDVILEKLKVKIAKLNETCKEIPKNENNKGKIFDLECKIKCVEGVMINLYKIKIKLSDY